MGLMKKGKIAPREASHLCPPFHMAPFLRGQSRIKHISYLCRYRLCNVNNIVVGVMKMWNTVPREGLEPTSLEFRVSVLPLHHVDSLMSQLYPRPPVCAAPHLRGQCRLLQH